VPKVCWLKSLSYKSYS